MSDLNDPIEPMDPSQVPDEGLDPDAEPPGPGIEDPVHPETPAEGPDDDTARPD